MDFVTDSLKAFLKMEPEMNIKRRIVMEKYYRKAALFGILRDSSPLYLITVE
ncbi:hypothetical protein [uncultured Clostridium sp.]|jgi:hypothetical protein|uniref:hypothetical protein n=1 Tax=uncultured Clostridium sp. TaxID=59620 RepID=UPI0025FB9D30|nr:hypothetical protein [uncultured Clostridium sp.]